MGDSDLFPEGRLGSTRIAILTINREELTAVRTRFQFSQNDKIAGTPYYGRRSPGARTFEKVARCATERANISANEMVARFIEDFYPEMFLLVGTAGGIGSQGVKLGDVITADYVEYAEFAKVAPGGIFPRKFPRDHPSISLRENLVSHALDDGNWKNTIAAAWPPGGTPPTGQPRATEGNIISSEKIWGDPTNAQQCALFAFYNKALACEMEACGVARAICAGRQWIDYNPRYLVIRGISDLADSPAAENDRPLWTQWAAAAAAAFAAALVDTYLDAPRPTIGKESVNLINRLIRNLSELWRR